MSQKPFGEALRDLMSERGLNFRGSQAPERVEEVLQLRAGELAPAIHRVDLRELLATNNHESRTHYLLFFFVFFFFFFFFFFFLPALSGAGVDTAAIAGVRSCHYRQYSDGTIVPDPTCTPGALNPAAVADPQTTICVPGYSKKVRPSESWSHPHKLASMREYGATGFPSNYEYDHLVAIEDGGAPKDTDNLWPQPHPQSYVKDRIENRLHAQICDGKITVQRAAAELEGDWTHAGSTRVPRQYAGSLAGVRYEMPEPGVPPDPSPAAS